MLRAFLAIQPAAEALRALRDLQRELGDVGADVRWVPVESMHLTVQFLGDVREAEVPEIDRRLRERFATIEPFDLECRGLGVFPNWKRPRVVWIGLHGDGLDAVAESAETVLSPLGFPPEEREFSPHITIGRMRSTRGWESLSRALRERNEQSIATSRIDHATLYRSQLRPDGAVYTPIVELPFKA
jgi:2'-5' RNA ligase